MIKKMVARCLQGLSILPLLICMLMPYAYSAPVGYFSAESAPGGDILLNWTPLTSYGDAVEPVTRSYVVYSIYRDTVNVFSGRDTDWIIGSLDPVSENISVTRGTTGTVTYVDVDGLVDGQAYYYVIVPYDTYFAAHETRSPERKAYADSSPPVIVGTPNHGVYITSEPTEVSFTISENVSVSASAFIVCYRCNDTPTIGVTGIDGELTVTVSGTAPLYEATALLPGEVMSGTLNYIHFWLTGADDAGNTVTGSPHVPDGFAAFSPYTFIRDDIAPSVQDVSIADGQIIDNEGDGEEWLVTINVSDSANRSSSPNTLSDDSFSLCYQKNVQPVERIIMVRVAGGVYQGIIPDARNGDLLSFWFEGSDQAGNQLESSLSPLALSLQSALHVVVDNTAPVCELMDVFNTTKGNRSAFSNGDILRVTASIDDVSLTTENITLFPGLLCSDIVVTASQFLNGLAVWELPVSTNYDGTITITINAIDGVGKLLTGVTTASVVVDNNPPVIEYVSGYANTGTLLIHFSEPVVISADVQILDTVTVNGAALQLIIPATAEYAKDVTASLSSPLYPGDCVEINSVTNWPAYDTVGNHITINGTIRDVVTGYRMSLYQDAELSIQALCNDEGACLINYIPVYARLQINESIVTSGSRLLITSGTGITQSVSLDSISESPPYVYSASFIPPVVHGGSCTIALDCIDVSGSAYSSLAPTWGETIICDQEAPQMLTVNMSSRLALDHASALTVSMMVQEDYWLPEDAVTLNWQLYSSSGQQKSQVISERMFYQSGKGSIQVRCTCDVTLGGSLGIGDNDRVILWFTAADAAGNSLTGSGASFLNPAAVLSIDAQPPSISVQYIPGNCIRSGTELMLLFVSEEILDVTCTPTILMEYDFDSSNDTLHTGNYIDSNTYVVTVTVPEKPGLVTVNVTGFTDSAGYSITTNRAVGTWIIDNTPPLFVSANIWSNTYLPKADYSLYVYVYEEDALCQGDILYHVSFNNREIIVTPSVTYATGNMYVCAGDLPLQQIETVASFCYWITGCDKAGNGLTTSAEDLPVTEESAYLGSVDGILPQVHITMPTRSSTVCDTVILAGTATENLQALEQVICQHYDSSLTRISEQSCSLINGSFSVTFNLVQGTNTLIVRATDVAGNTASAQIQIGLEDARYSTISGEIPVNVSIPVGAYPDDVELEIKSYSSSDPLLGNKLATENTCLGALQILVPGVQTTSFDIPVQVDADLSQAPTTACLAVVWWDEEHGTWNSQGITGTSVDGTTVTFFTDHFTLFGIFTASDITAPDIVGITIDDKKIVTGDYVTRRPELRAMILDPETGSGLTSYSISLYLCSSGLEQCIAQKEYVCMATNAPKQVVYRPDTELSEGSYKYIIRASDANGNSSVAGSPQFKVSSGEFTFTALHGPNPFSPNNDGIKDSCKIAYTISSDADITIKIFGINGYLIREWHFFAGDQQAGRAGYNEIVWDGTDRFDDPVANGIYFAVITARDRQDNKRRQTLKIAVLK